MKINNKIIGIGLFFSVLILDSTTTQADNLPMEISRYSLPRIEYKQEKKQKSIEALIKTTNSLSNSIGTYFEAGNYTYEVISENPNTVKLKGFAYQIDDVDMSVIDIPIEVTNGFEKFLVKGIEEYAFFMNKKINSVNIPSIVEIGASAFEKTSVKELKAPKLEIVNNSGFADSQLELIEIPEIKELGDLALSGHKLESIDFPNLLKLGEQSLKGENLKKVSLIKLREAGTHAFWQNSKLETVDLPSVETVGFWAFYDTNLTEISLPQAIEIEEQAFSYNSCKISKVDLPKVKIIGNRAFYNHQMTELYLPEAVTLGQGTFGKADSEELSGLKTIDLPKVKNIDVWAFSNNQLKKLETSDIPSVSIISDGSFNNNQLETINLPNIIEIRSTAFEDNKLESIYLPNTKVIDEQAFSKNKSNDLKLFVSDALTKVEDNIFSSSSINGNIDIYNMGTKDIEQISKTFPSNIVADWWTGETKFNTTNLWSSENYSYSILDSNIQLISGDTFMQEIGQTFKKGKTILRAGEDWQDSPINESDNLPLLGSETIEWYKDNTVLPGQNKSVLNFASLKATDSGDYHAVIDGQKMSGFKLEVTSSSTGESSDSNATIAVEKSKDSGQVIFSSDASDKATINFEQINQGSLKTEYPETTKAVISLKDTRKQASKYRVDAKIEENGQNTYDFYRNELEILLNLQTTEVGFEFNSSPIQLSTQAQQLFTTEYDSTSTNEEKSVLLNASLKSLNFDKLESGKQYSTKIVWQLTPSVGP